MERLFFLWIGGFETRSHYMTPVWMSKEKQWGKKKNPDKQKPKPPLSLSRIISPLIFYIKPCLFHQHPKITIYDLGPVKLQQELSSAERIIAAFTISFPA